MRHQSFHEVSYLIWGLRICILAALVLTAGVSLAEDKEKEAESLISRAKQLSDIRSEAAPAFEMRVEFKLIDEHSKESDGTYVETWASPEKWRREITSDVFRNVVVANGNKTWTSNTSAPYPPGIDVLGFRMDRALFSTREWIAKITNRKLGSVEVRCIESRRGGSRHYSALCFEKGSGLLASESGAVIDDDAEVTCVYEGYDKFGDRALPRVTRCSEKGNPVFESELVELKRNVRLESASFMPPAGAEESVNCRGGIQIAPKAIYAPNPIPPKHNSNRGTVWLSLSVGPDGIPEGLKVLRSFDPAFSDAAMNAVSSWRFQPAMCDGQAITTKATVEVVFRR
jgi:TonB family protein